jgi:hypothetical protein
VHPSCSGEASSTPADHTGVDRIKPLLHRLTGVPYADLNIAVRTLTIDQFERFDALAGEILDDTRAIAVVDNRASRRLVASSA